MIEINLVPDVKLELLKARQQRRMVISGSILVTMIAGGIVVLMAIYAFGVQTVADTLADNGIKTESNKLINTQDLSKTLTIQAQLDQLSTGSSERSISSRLFDIIAAAVPEGTNAVTVRQLGFDAENKRISIQAEASNGYEALEVFKKTLGETTFQYNVDGQAQEPVKIATSISDGDRQYSEDTAGRQTLRFSVSFIYPDELFNPTSESGRVVGPNRQTATDSAQGVPTSLFDGGEE